MVLGVCRRLLHDADQAEDAFQAAFLVLARKAGAIQSRPLLSAWLYGVAYKVAARLRGRAWRRQAREMTGIDLATVAASVDPDPSDLAPLLHEEVQRLPDKYRNPIVLCYLEGKTHEEAALLLHWPLGTVKGRLSRARGLLRTRLTRRGVTASEGMMATALVANPVIARAKLVDATIRAATRFAAGEEGAGKLASARAIMLSQGVLRTMILTKVKIAGALLLAVTMLGGSAGWLAFRAPAAAMAVAAAPDAAAKADDKVNDDNEAIQGTWLITGVEINGQEQPSHDKPATWTVKADKIMLASRGDVEVEASYKLDPTKKPKQLDFTLLKGPTKDAIGKTSLMIYSIDGDVLKIGEPFLDANERPAELATKKGDKALLLTLRRLKPAKDKPGADREALQGAWKVATVEPNGWKDLDIRDVLANAATQKWVFKADKIAILQPGEKNGQAASYTLDSTREQKEIDLTPEGGKTQQGIYSLEGDVLRLCFPSPDGGPRPTELSADPGSKTVLLTLKRLSAGKAKPKEDKPKDDAKLKKLLQDWCDVAKEEFKMRKQEFAVGKITPEELASSARRVMTAELERSDKKEDRVMACEEYLQQITEAARIAKIKLEAGKMGHADAVEAEYYRLEAEVLLEREKAK
jgi:RNA polymerase sigma-70 factor (ECF subfamily)